MHEAHNHIGEKPGWSVATHRRLSVVNSEEIPPAPAAAEFVEMLLSVATRKDRQAFAALFRHFGPRLKTFFMRGAMSAGLAEDLVQETMLTVWRKASYFDPARAGVATWIFTIARNRRIDHLRRQRDPASLPFDPPEMPPSQEEVFVVTERDTRIRRALAGLSEEQQTILRMAYFSEKSQSEIAGELGIPLGTVKSRTRLAMNRLRTLLEDET